MHTSEHLFLIAKTGQDCVVCQVNQKSAIVGSFMKSYCNHHNYSTSIIFTYILPIICILSQFFLCAISWCSGEN